MAPGAGCKVRGEHNRCRSPVSAVERKLGACKRAEKGNALIMIQAVPKHDRPATSFRCQQTVKCRRRSRGRSSHGNLPQVFRQGIRTKHGALNRRKSRQLDSFISITVAISNVLPSPAPPPNQREIGS